MAFWLPVGLVVIILAGFNLLARRRRRRLLERLRAEWGRPTDRTRDLPGISHYHRVFAVDRESPLDARTGEDLDLDAVFAVLDRTESDIGHFADRIDAHGLSFDYRLRRGPARSWNAIALLDVCGAPPRLVERALARTAGLAEQRRLGGKASVTE